MREGRSGIAAFLIRTEILFVLLLFSTGCHSLGGWAADDVIAYAEGPLLEEAERFVSETVGEEFAELQDAADADQDGDTTWAEWWSFVFGSSGGLWLLGWLLRTFIRRQKSEEPAETSACPCQPEPEVVLPGGRQPSGAEDTRPWYEMPVSPAPAVPCPPASA